MGCVSSKPLKKQARAEGWASPPPKRNSRSKTFNSEGKDDHPHLVALTSSSYGLLKVDSPKPAEEPKHNKTTGLESLNEMYDKLRGLELAESAPKSWKEVSNMLETIKPGLEKTESNPAKIWKVAPADFSVAEGPETIDIGEMMRGLDEDTPRSPPISHAVASQTPLSTKALVSNKFDKSMPFHTVDELDACVGRPKDSAVAKVSQDPPQDVFGNSALFAMGRNGTAHAGFEKENAKPPGSDNGLIRERENVAPFKTAIVPRSHFMPAQIIPKSNTPHLQIPTVLSEESNANRRGAPGNRPLSKDLVIKSIPISSTPFSNYSSSRGKVHLTLNVDYQNDLFTDKHLSQVVLTPADSISRRTLVNRPELLSDPSTPLFDPDLLATYEKAMEDLSEDNWNAAHVNVEVQHTFESHSTANKELKTSTEREAAHETSGHTDCNGASDLSNKTMITKIARKLYDPFESFEEKCPRGGGNTLVLYTTTLRGIRKTFEDCNKVREILQSFGLSIDERDVSMHLEFRNELRELMGNVVSVPRVFIKGRYIGGAEEVTKLHEDGKLGELLEGLPKELNGGNCDGCGGIRFVPCLECSGSCKILDDDHNVIRCPDCNENGLIQCPICS